MIEIGKTEALVPKDADWKFVDNYSYKGNDLGADYTRERTVFKVWSPTASQIRVCLFTKGSDSEPGAEFIRSVPMERDDLTAVWSAQIKGDLDGVYYTYRVVTDGINNETVDIYAKAAGVNGNRGMIVDLRRTDPEGWENDKRIVQPTQTQAIIWEVHVKDFSIHPSSGVSEKNRGKYLAFTEEDTTLNNDGLTPTCLNYLKKMGVNYVHLLPVFDFGSVDEKKPIESTYNWGYDPKNYNVPEGSYSSNPYDGHIRIREFKKMVMALHNAGIGVVMDMVYNHTYETETSWFNRTVPDYYYRKNPDGSFSNGSGCGNDTASEHSMFAKYMVDSVMYWVTEYHLDGVRFDLMGLHDVSVMNSIRTALDTLPNGKRILMYGEAWDMFTACAPGTVMANKNNIGALSNRIAAFNDGIRDAIKGNTFDKFNKGFAQGCGHPDAVKSGITAKSAGYGWGWAKSPSQTLTYCSCHDNYTLWDKLMISFRGANCNYDERDEAVLAMNKLAAAVILTSQGMVLFQAGEEIARSKKGEHNSYNLPVEINALNWNNFKKFRDLHDYYAGLIEIRKSFSPFTDNTSTSAMGIRFLNTYDGHVMCYVLRNQIDPELGWNMVCVIFNSDPYEKKSVYLTQDCLPNEWIQIADENYAGVTKLREINSDYIDLEPSSCAILVDKESFERADIRSRRGRLVVKHIEKQSGAVLEIEQYSGVLGDKYRTYASRTLMVDYDCRAVLGKQNGVYQENTTEVVYYYAPCNEGVGTIVVKYLNEDGTKELAPKRVVRDRKSRRYVVRTLPHIEGYELDFSRYPTNSSGVIENDVTEVYYYFKSIAPRCVKLYYKDKCDRSNINAYVYGNDGEYLFSGAWPGSPMKPIGGGLWELDVNIGDPADRCVPEAIFNFDGQQEPGNGQGGYKIRGCQAIITNKKVKYTGFYSYVHIVYITMNAEILKHDILKSQPDDAAIYTAERKEFDGYCFYKQSGESEGTFSTTPKYVFFTYREDDD
ncbi:MAG: type I pullulanase [Clostridiales bacterium]|nr:type I pullulanase [Clostridiales bacterium]